MESLLEYFFLQLYKHS